MVCERRSLLALTAFRREVGRVFRPSRTSVKSSVQFRLATALDGGIARLRAGGVSESRIRRMVKDLMRKHPGFLTTFDRCLR